MSSQTQNGRSLGPNDQIRTAIIGTGGQGQHHIKYQTQADPNVRLVALCDVDPSRVAEAVKKVPEEQRDKVKTYTDYRKLLDDPAIDCVVIASTNQWHAIQTVHACQAGKDVYVEKPSTHCVSEGRQMIQAAEKYDRVVQVGHHLRANEGRQEAIRLLHDGLIGKIFQTEYFFYRSRESIGIAQDGTVPEGVDYDRWLGPAPKRPFNANRFHYNWHWFWDYGGGEIAGNGPHFLDILVDGMGRPTEFPQQVSCQGGRYVWRDQGETPNSATVAYRYADGARMLFSIIDPVSKQAQRTQPNELVFYGEKGIMKLGAFGKFTTIVDGKPGPSGKNGKGRHTQLAKNFYDVVRSRKIDELLSPANCGHTVSSLCHLANIAYRCDRTLHIDPKTETILNDQEASALLTREYRKPYTMPSLSDV